MVDWWALGVLCFEMIVGMTPFYNKNRNEMLNKIKASRVTFPDPKKFGIPMSLSCQDFINKCLEKKKQKRIGWNNDVDEILAHPWFEGVERGDIMEKNILPPFMPTLKSDTDTSNFECREKLAETHIPLEKIKEIEHMKGEFQGFEAGFNILKHKGHK